MGNNQSQGENFLQRYEQIRKEQGGTIIADKQTENNYFLKEYNFADKQQYSRELERLKQEKSSPSTESVLNICHIEQKEYNNFCSNTYKIYAIYEYPLITLQEEINARKKENKYFQECELWAILQSCVNALEQIKPVIALHPKLIFIVPDGMLKIINNDLITEDHRFLLNESVYYAPEKITNFHQSDNQNKLKKQTIFSLGMTILSAALLEELNNCYQYQNYQFLQKVLEQSIEKLVSRYSQQFIQILTMLLEPNPNKRSSLPEVKALLNEVWETQQNQTQIHKDSASVLHKIQNSGPQFTKDPYVDSYANTFNQSKRQSKQLYLPQPSVDKQNLFTDPKLLEMIRKDLQAIQQQRNISTMGQSTHKISMDRQSINDQIVLSSMDNSNLKENHLKSKQEGQFVAQVYEDGRKYEGFIVKGLRNGLGKLTYADGAYYEGHFKNGLMNGKGSLFYGEGKVAYEGQWTDDQFDGFGILHNENPLPLNGQYNYEDFDVIDDFWVKYEGEFKNDCKEGKGKFYLTNGETFEGQFQNDVLNGRGTFTTLENEEIKGVWENNILIEHE